MGCGHVNQFLLSLYSQHKVFFIAETFNHNMQYYSSKTKPPLNMSGSHQPTSTYPLNFNSDIKIISATLRIQHKTLYTFVSVLCYQKV